MIVCHRQIENEQTGLKDDQWDAFDVKIKFDCASQNPKLIVKPTTSGKQFNITTEHLRRFNIVNGDGSMTMSYLKEEKLTKEQAMSPHQLHDIFADSFDMNALDATTADKIGKFLKDVLQAGLEVCHFRMSSHPRGFCEDSSFLSRLLFQNGARVLLLRNQYQTRDVVTKYWSSRVSACVKGIYPAYDIVHVPGKIAWVEVLESGEQLPQIKHMQSPADNNVTVSFPPIHRFHSNKEYRDLFSGGLIAEHVAANQAIIKFTGGTSIYDIKIKTVDTTTLTIQGVVTFAVEDGAAIPKFGSGTKVKITVQVFVSSQTRNQAPWIWTPRNNILPLLLPQTMRLQRATFLSTSWPPPSRSHASRPTAHIDFKCQSPPTRSPSNVKSRLQIGSQE